MSSGINIRRARMTDIPELRALEDQRFTTDRISQRSFRRWLGLGHEGLAVAVCDGRTLGYVLVLRRRGSHSARLYSIAVDQAQAGKGIGKALLGWAEQRARRWGATQMRLEVQIGNQAARALYARSGYTLIKTLPAYYQDGSAAVRMIKAIPAR